MQSSGQLVEDVVEIFWERGRFFTTAQTVLVFSVADEVKVLEHKLGHHDCLQVDGNTGLLDISVSGRSCIIELTQLG